MKFKTPALYLSAPVDEVALTLRAAPIARSFGGALPDAAFFSELAAREGLDLATAVLYQAIREAKDNASFVAELEVLSAQPDASESGQAIVVVPALFYAEHPEVGADGQLALDIARASGFTAMRLPSECMGSMSRNAALLHDFLKTMTPQPVWLMSLSKGGGEVRLLFDFYRDDPVLARIRGWINVCGLIGGTPIHDLRLKTVWTRLKYRALLAVLQARKADFLEYHTWHPHWQRPFAVPRHVTVVNAVAIPLPCHMQTHLIGRYRSLAPFGPNDGMVACRSALVPGGVTYPMWGSDHFFRGADVPVFLYRLFRWIRMRSASVRPGRIVESAHAH